MSSRPKKPKTTPATGAPKAIAAKKEKAIKTLDLKKAGKPMETFPKSIAVKLTAVERDARVTTHTKVWKKIQALEMEKKLFDDDKNASIKKLKAEFEQLMRAMESGFEDREIKCGLFPVFEKNQVLTVRLDTEEIVGDRTMSAEEKNKLTPKKPGTVTKLSSVKDDNQVKADENLKKTKDSALPPETSDGGKGKDDEGGRDLPF